MKKNIFAFGMMSVIAVLSSAYIIKNSGGKTDRTGSPGEGTCADCHSGGSGTTITNISFNPSVSSGSYTPNQTYTITVNVINNTLNNFGFACELLNSSTLSSTGTMQNAGSGVQFLTGMNGRRVATHTSPKSGAGSASFTFEWVAPSSGNVNVYAIGNAVNLNGNITGDVSSLTTTLTLSPDLTSIAMNFSILSGIFIYPNPVKDLINIQFSASTSIRELKVQLTDLNGRILSEQSFNNISKGINMIRYNTPEKLNNGLYLLKISPDDNQRISKLILIQK